MESLATWNGSPSDMVQKFMPYFIHIDLYKLGFGVFFRQFFENGANVLAGATPRCCEVDNNKLGLGELQNRVVVIHVLEIAHHCVYCVAGMVTVRYGSK